MSIKQERLIEIAQAALWALCITSDKDPTACMRRVAAAAIGMVDHFDQSEAEYRLAVDAAVEIVENTIDSLKCERSFTTHQMTAPEDKHNESGAGNPRRPNNQGNPVMKTTTQIQPCDQREPLDFLCSAADVMSRAIKELGADGARVTTYTTLVLRFGCEERYATRSELELLQLAEQLQLPLRLISRS